MRVYPLLLAALGVLIASPVAGQPILVQFTGSVATVTGTPFGIAPAPGTNISGFFTYDLATSDVNADPNRGDYPHERGGAFAATVEGHGITVTGSATPWVQIENLGSDTFRFLDGPRVTGPTGGTMATNAIEDATIRLTFTVTDDSGTTFDDDALPTEFPFAFPGTPHTFSLGDSQGTLLIQISDTVTPTEVLTWGRLKTGFPPR